MRTTDNNCGEPCQDLGDLTTIANKDIIELQKENPDFLVFTSNPAIFKDVNNNRIFSLDDDRSIITTYNVMGFIGVNESMLTIGSRFQSKERDKDYFLHYMLQKVFGLNIIDLKTNTNDDSIWELFLIYLFPHYLQKALNQGLYKEYQSKSYNDANVKGSIDVVNHIKQNNPFMGKIAYRPREHNYDNRITQLIRHTIEHIRTHPIGSSVLNSNNETRIGTNQILFSTNGYNKNDRQRIISKNNKVVNHPFYNEYEPLRKLCLQILRHEGISYAKERDKIYGIIFDGSWLWEEYLNTVFAPLGFLHPENKTGNKPIYLFSDPRAYKRFPDFYHLEKSMVLDAKYKKLDHSRELSRDDLHQVITYMYVLKSRIGGFVFPYSSGESIESQIGVLGGYGGSVKRYGMQIPSGVETFYDFKLKMKKSEEALCFLVKNESIHLSSN